MKKNSIFATIINFLNVSQMKKLVLFLAVATAVAFASCGAKEEAAEEVAAPAVEEVVVEEVAADTTAVEVAADSVAK